MVAQSTSDFTEILAELMVRGVYDICQSAPPTSLDTPVGDGIIHPRG